MAQISREDFFNMQNVNHVPHTMPPAPDFVRLRSPTPTAGKHERKEESPQPCMPPKAAPQNRTQNGSSLLKMLNFRAIKMDSDRSVIIALMLLLMGDSHDELLLLALLYIML